MTQQQFKEFVHQLALANQDFDFLNSDEDKMKIVYMEMLNNSQHEFRIFAGTLACNTTNSPDFVETMSDYIERGGSLYILLNDYKEDIIFQSQLFKRLAFYKLKGRDIVVRKSADHPFIKTPDGKKKVHFAIGDKNSYRIETDIENRTAICNMNNVLKAGEFASFFDELFQKAEGDEINLLTLFKLQ